MARGFFPHDLRSVSLSRPGRRNRDTVRHGSGVSDNWNWSFFWTASRCVKVVRAVIAYRAELDPWLEFPQYGSCFLFGKRKSPVPVGALCLLWDSGPPWRKPCHRCGGDLRAYVCGGLLTVKWLRAVCVDCERCFTEVHDGSLGSAAAWLRPLRGTEFFMSSGCFGGTYGSEGALLLKALELECRPRTESATQFKRATLKLHRVW
jgi:hypothetical protein